MMFPPEHFQAKWMPVRVKKMRSGFCAGRTQKRRKFKTDT